MNKIWWRYAVLRGEGLPADLDGKWYEVPSLRPLDDEFRMYGVSFYPTNQWEQRDNGEVAVVYRRFYG